MYKVKGKPWAYSGAIDVSDCELPQNGLQKYLLSQQFQAIHKMMVMYTTQ